MSIINVKYDTKSKKMDANMDGKPVKNIHSISTYHRGNGQHSMTIMQSDPTNEDEGYSQQHMLYCSESDGKYAYIDEKGGKHLPIGDCNHVKAASAALSPGGFRGQKFSAAPAKDMPAIRARVRAAYNRCFGNKDMPQHLKAECDEQLNENENKVIKILAEKLKKQMGV